MPAKVTLENMQNFEIDNKFHTFQRTQKRSNNLFHSSSVISFIQRIVNFDSDLLIQSVSQSKFSKRSAHIWLVESCFWHLFKCIETRIKGLNVQNDCHTFLNILILNIGWKPKFDICLEKFTMQTVTWQNAKFCASFAFYMHEI